MAQNKTRTVEHWETVAVTALPPGWRNVFSDESGRYTVACPAILLQELRETIVCTDVSRDDQDAPKVQTRTEVHDPPFETRAVFADSSDGVLDAACRILNYERTAGPGDRMDGVFTDEDPETAA